MANVTLSIEDEKLARFRVHAAQNRTTVNALIRKHVDEVLDGDERRAKARARIKEMMAENLARDAERAAARARGEAVEEETWQWSRKDTYAERDWPKS